MRNTSLLILLLTLILTSCEMKKYGETVNNDDSSSEVTDNDSASSDDQNDVENDPDSDEVEDVDSENPDEDLQCGSVYFNGIDSYISVKHDDALNFGKTWTVEAWIMQDNLNDQNPIVRKGDETEDPSFWIYGKTSDITGDYTDTPNGGFQYGSASTESSWLQSKSEVQAMKWFHIALSKSESQIMLFINGVLQQNISSPQTMVSNSENLYFGARLNSKPIYFAGLIDEIRLSSTARYNDKFIPEKRLEADNATIAVWHFEEGEGTETTSEGTNILKGILNGSTEFVRNCNFKESECENDCFEEDATRCSEGMLQTCRKDNAGCLEYINEACSAEICGDSFSCAVDNCPFPGASECFDGEIRVCIEDDNELLDWSASAKCFDEKCGDETSCLSCSNECGYEGETKCLDGKLSFCTKGEQCLEWGSQTNCNLNECADENECRSDGWKNIVSGTTKCGINNAGELFCWINGSHDSTKMSSRNDWSIITGFGDYESLYYSSQHFCAIASGELYCYGKNSSGQLGNGTTASQDSFIKTGSKSDWTDVSAGKDSVCGIAGGELYCWGNNILSPQKIGEKNDWQEVNGNCGIGSGHIYCWDSFPPEPALADPQNGWEKVSSYFYSHICGIRNGELFCWGKNDEGQLGDGTNENQVAPTKIGSRNDWESINCSNNYSCGIAGGETFCWGGNVFGRLGIGSTESSKIPIKVGEKNNWHDVSSDDFSSCGIAGNNIYCWGLFVGPYTNGSNTAIPLRAEKALNFSDISVGSYHICGISNGDIYCNDFFGQGYSNFIKISDSSDWSTVSSGYSHGCAIRNGALYCMGTNSSGQVGDSTFNDKKTLTRVGTGTNWTEVSAGYAHTCGITDKELYCWGDNASGKLGDETVMLSNVPLRIGSGTEWDKISAGNSHTCGITDGMMFCWGDNSSGELGDGTLTSFSQPKKVGNKNDWEEVLTGQNSTCGIAGGEIFCWGDIAKKISGSDSIISNPIKVGNFNDYKKLASTLSSLCAIRENNKLYCWYHYSNPYTHPHSFLEMVADSEWKEISGRDSVLCGISIDNKLYCTNLIIMDYYSPVKLVNP